MHIKKSKNNTNKTDSKWDAFISYRRSDGTKSARWLRNRLQNYKLPKQLREEYPKKLDIYLDTTYERATKDFFTNNIEPALKNSRFLIVVSTPDSKKNRSDGTPNWVIREIERFGNTPQRENIIVAIAKGDFNDPLPGDLNTKFPRMEIVDLRSRSFTRYLWWPKFSRLNSEFLKIVAPLHEIPVEKMPILRNEENYRQHRKIFSFVSAFLLIFIVLGILSFIAWTQREEANRRAEVGWILSTQNIVNSELVEKRKTARSTFLTLKSRKFTEEINNTIISLLEKPDLKKIPLPSGIKIYQAIFPATPDMKLWSWINFAQVRNAGAAVTISKDGSSITTVLSGAKPFTINTKTGKMMTIPNIVDRIIYPVALSQNGRFVAGRTKKGIIVWDLNTGVLTTLKMNDQILQARYLFFDPSSRFLVTIDDVSFSIWRLSPLELLGSSPPTKNHELNPLGSSGFGFNSDGTLLATAQIVDGGRLYEMNLWKIPECKCIATVNIENESHNGSTSFDPTSRIAFHPCGSFILQTLGPIGIARWKIQQSSTGETKIIQDGIIRRGLGAEAIKFSPDGRWLIVVDSEKSPYVSLVDAYNEHTEMVIESEGEEEDEKRSIRHLNWSANGDYVYWTTNGGINLWHFLKPLSKVVSGSFELLKLNQYSPQIELNDTAQWLIAPGRSDQSGLRVINLKNNSIFERELSTTSNGPIIFLPGSNLFWILGSSVELWDPNGSNPLKIEKLSEFWVSWGAINSEGHRITTRMGRIIDLDTHKDIFSVAPLFNDMKFYYFGDVLNADGNHYLLVRGRRYSEEFEITLYDIKQKKSILHIGGLQKIYSFSLSKDANRLVIGFKEKAVIYNSLSNSIESEMIGTSGNFSVISISPDGQWVVSGGLEHVFLWEAKTGKKIYTLPDKGVKVLDIRSNPLILISAHDDGSIRIWDFQEISSAVSRFKDATNANT